MSRRRFKKEGHEFTHEIKTEDNVTKDKR